MRHQLAFVLRQHAEELELVRGKRHLAAADRDRRLVLAAAGARTLCDDGVGRALSGHA